MAQFDNLIRARFQRKRNTEAKKEASARNNWSFFGTSMEGVPGAQVQDPCQCQGFGTVPFVHI